MFAGNSTSDSKVVTKTVSGRTDRERRAGTNEMHAAMLNLATVERDRRDRAGDGNPMISRCAYGEPSAQTFDSCSAIVIAHKRVGMS